MSNEAPRLVLHNTMGALYIGTTLAAILYGCSCVQAYNYYERYPNDPRRMKLLVAAIWILDTAHQVMVSHFAYEYLITHYAEPEFLGEVVWSLYAEVILTGIVAFIVQMFFALRIWRLSHRNWFLAALLGALILTEFGLSLAYSFIGFDITTFAGLTKLKGISMSVNVFAAAGDLVLAITLCILLQNSRTGFKRSDSIVSRLMIYAVNTGLLTSVCATLSLVTIIAYPTAYIYICFYHTMARLYSNSLMATLNARDRIRNIGSENQTKSEHVTVSLSQFRGRTMKNESQDPPPSGQIAIMVDTETTETFYNPGQTSFLPALHKGKGDTKVEVGGPGPTAVAF